MFVPVYIELRDSSDRGAQTTSLQRKAASSSHSDFSVTNLFSTKQARPAAEHSRLAACATKHSPFWTWFIDNPRPKSGVS
jgi:hypothetical protein